MPVQARQARTANTFAPLQQRSTFAGGQLRWYFAPSMYMWATAATDQTPVGATVSAVKDQVGLLTISQGVAAKQPLKSVQRNVPGWQFDGVNDCLVTSSSVWATQAITVLIVRWITSAVQNVVFERSNDYNTSNIGYVDSASAADEGYGVKGNAGYNVQSAAYSGTTWLCQTVVADKSQPGATEVVGYVNGVPSVQTPVATNDNNNDYGNTLNNIGSRSNGTSSPTQGWIQTVLVFRRALSAAEIRDTALYALQQAGVS